MKPKLVTASFEMELGSRTYLASFHTATKTWFVTTTIDGKVRTFTAEETRTHQFVNQSRAQEMIARVISHSQAEMALRVTKR